VSRALDDLHPTFRPVACEFLARLTERGIAVLIVDTLRTPAEHAANLAKGVSWTARSKHLDGLALDVCPYEQYQLHGPDKLQWNVNDPVWLQIGEAAELLGLRWGGRWLQRDMGHVEYVQPEHGMGGVRA
jgi:peptidoglycan L-alanyl-D-glutamate endopeptidase CwlK